MRKDGRCTEDRCRPARRPLLLVLASFQWRCEQPPDSHHARLCPAPPRHRANVLLRAPDRTSVSSRARQIQPRELANRARRCRSEFPLFKVRQFPGLHRPDGALELLLAPVRSRVLRLLFGGPWARERKGCPTTARWTYHWAMRRPDPVELEYAFVALLIAVPMAYYVVR